MAKPWDPNGVQALLYVALRSAGPEGLEIGKLYEVAAISGDRSNVLMGMQALRRGGYARHGNGRGHWVCGFDGPVPPIRGYSPQQNAAVTPAELGRLLHDALRSHPTGMNSLELARQFMVDAWMVDAALQPAVEQHVFVTCKVMRDGVTATHYRISAGGVLGYDWKQQADATWENRRATMVKEMAASVGTLVDAAHSAGRQTAATAAATFADVASEVVSPAPAPLPPAPLPVVGMLDIDAIHQAQAAAAGQPEPGEFICALYSNGALLVRLRDHQITLPEQHTRALLRYLDRMRDDEPQAEPAKAVA